MAGNLIFKPVIDVEKCQTCAVCTRGCPAELLPEQRKEEVTLRGHVYHATGSGPSVGVDGVFEMPPCQLACPIHQDIMEYVQLIARKKYGEALKLIRETNALPSVTGYVCHRPCEAECVRNLVDEPSSIRALKRFVADFDGGKLIPPRIKRQNGRRVSIIGSGPSGLAAAYDLARDGYQLEIIEALSEPGGMLRWAIPRFRLPEDILSRDIKYIEKMGVTIKTGIRFGVDITLPELKKDGVDAIIMAIGTQESLKMGVGGEGGDLSGLSDCLTFLMKYRRGEPLDLGCQVIVVGGGNAAIDTARAVRRCGVMEVVILYRRGHQEMLADETEVREAEAEGVRISYFTMPFRIVTKGGRVVGLECVATKLGEPDESGRRAPIPIKGSEFMVEATSVISAIGQRPDLSWNREALRFDLSPRNTFVIDDNCMTSIEGVFAAGDVVNGPTSVVEAMASGKKAARAVDSYLAKKEC
jgi:NADPH-dependent glutamate synthase beta subunit-like oxidoreductase